MPGFRLTGTEFHSVQPGSCNHHLNQEISSNCTITNLVCKVVIIRSRLARMKFCLVLPGSRQCCKFFTNFILQLHVESFIPAFVMPRSLFCNAEIPSCWDEIFQCNGFNKMKKLIKTSVWNIPKKQISTDRSYFYCIFATHMKSICEKKVNKCLYRISLFCDYF